MKAEIRFLSWDGIQTGSLPLVCSALPSTGRPSVLITLSLCGGHVTPIGSGCIYDYLMQIKKTNKWDQLLGSEATST